MPSGHRPGPSPARARGRAPLGILCLSWICWVYLGYICIYVLNVFGIFFGIFLCCPPGFEWHWLICRPDEANSWLHLGGKLASVISQCDLNVGGQFQIMGVSKENQICTIWVPDSNAWTQCLLVPLMDSMLRLPSWLACQPSSLSLPRWLVHPKSFAEAKTRKSAKSRTRQQGDPAQIGTNQYDN